MESGGKRERERCASSWISQSHLRAWNLCSKYLPLDCSSWRPQYFPHHHPGVRFPGSMDWKPLKLHPEYVSLCTWLCHRGAKSTIDDVQKVSVTVL